jgi:hypothetical protein
MRPPGTDRYTVVETLFLSSNRRSIDRRPLVAGLLLFCQHKDAVARDKIKYAFDAPEGARGP